VILISPRTGRPKVENPKCFDVKVRFDENMHNSLMAYCKENSITKAEAIREAVLMLLSSKK